LGHFQTLSIPSPSVCFRGYSGRSEADFSVDGI
jgi:hypothetical protein